MAVKSNNPGNTSGQFTADKDYYGETEDGRSYLKVAAGVTIPISEAVEMGIVKGGKADAEGSDVADTDESKADKADENKAAAPAENKGGKK